MSWIECPVGATPRTGNSLRLNHDVLALGACSFPKLLMVHRLHQTMEEALQEKTEDQESYRRPLFLELHPYQARLESLEHLDAYATSA